MPTDTAKVQDSVPDEKANLYSFQNIFAQVVACTRKYGITEKVIFNLLPVQISNWYSHSQFSRGYQDALEGTPPEGIMAENVAIAILAAIKVLDDRELPLVRTTKKPKGNTAPVKETPTTAAMATAELSIFFTSLGAAKASEPESTPEPEQIIVPEVAPDLFEIEQVRERIAVILESVDITPQDVYLHMKPADRTPENEAQVNGWFDGSVKQSPKALVSAFFYATIKALEKKSNATSQTYPSDYQPGLHLVQ